MKQGSIKTLLIGNFPPDNQESMLRFANLLHRNLIERNWPTQLISPQPIISKYANKQQGLKKWLGYVDKIILFPKKLKKVIQEERPNLVHICDHSNAYYLQQCKHLPHLITCNDLIAIRSALGEIPQHQTRYTGKKLQAYILKNLKSSKHFACISKNTKNDLVRITGINEKKACVIYMGQSFSYKFISKALAQIHTSKILRKTNYNSNYLIHVGHNAWYKNKLGVLYLFREIKLKHDKNLDLVLVGPPLDESLLSWINANNLTQHIHVVSNISNENLNYLYSGAELLLFPSLLEGFGWPIIEAQACGCPVITSNIAPMTELGTDSAIYLDVLKDTSPAEIASWASKQAVLALKYLNADLTNKNTIIRKGITNAARFSDALMAESYIKYYQEILHNA